MTLESDTALLVAQKAKTDEMMEQFKQLKNWKDRYLLIKRYRDSISEEVTAAHDRIFQTPNSWNELDMWLTLLKRKMDEEKRNWFNDLIRTSIPTSLLGL
jgi:hypothetical protein